MSTPLVLALVLVVVISWELVRAYRFDDRIPERWAGDHGLELTEESRPLVRRHLRRSRLWRTWGGVLGATLPTLIDYVLNGRVQVLGFGTDGQNAPLGFGSIFVGYLLGALGAAWVLAMIAAFNAWRRERGRPAADPAEGLEPGLRAAS